MKSMKQAYAAPAVEEIKIASENILADSNELIWVPTDSSGDMM